MLLPEGLDALHSEEQDTLHTGSQDICYTPETKIHHAATIQTWIQ